MLKEAILQKSFTSHLPDENEFKELVKRSVTYIDDAADLPVAAVAYLDQAYNVQGVTYVCEDKGSGVYEWETYDTSGQNLSYADASGKPTLNGITLNGAMTKADLGIASDNSERTAATTLLTTDKVPINDDKYTTIDKLGNKIAEEYSTQREFTEDYPFLYFQSDLSMDLTNTTSTSELVLTDATTNSIEWVYNPTQSGIIKENDEINVQFSTTGLVNGVIYNATIEVYINTIKIAEKNTTFTNPMTVSPQINKILLTNIVGDTLYTSDDVIRVKLLMNITGGSGAVTIYIYNSATRSSYLNIRKYIGQTNDTTETLATGSITLYNSQKNTLRYINYTYAGGLTISINHNTSISKGIEVSGAEHQVIIYNNSGATRAIYISSSPTGLPSAISQNIDNGKYLCFKYKLTNYNGSTLMYITENQNNIVAG